MRGLYWFCWVHGFHGFGFHVASVGFHVVLKVFGWVGGLKGLGEFQWFKMFFLVFSVFGVFSWVSQGFEGLKGSLGLDGVLNFSVDRSNLVLGVVECFGRFRGRLRVHLF